jgi:hypothetical protein
MWVHAFVCLLPLFAGPLPSLQDSTPRYIFGKAEAVDVDRLKVDGIVVGLRGAKAVTYKRKPEELDPIFHLQMMLDRQPVRCEELKKRNDSGKQWFLGTCYLVGKRTEVNLNRWVVANGFGKSFGNDDYGEDEKLAQKLGVGMWKNQSGLRLIRSGHRFPRMDKPDRGRSIGGGC